MQMSKTRGQSQDAKPSRILGKNELGGTKQQVGKEAEEFPKSKGSVYMGPKTEGLRRNTKFLMKRSWTLEGKSLSSKSHPITCLICDSEQMT